MKKLFLRAEFGPLWEPWEEDEIGRKGILAPSFLEELYFSRSSLRLTVYDTLTILIARIASWDT